MLVDSGAGPSVLDVGTVRELGMESHIHRHTSRIYGIGKEPIHMIGNIFICVDMGDNLNVELSFGVLLGTVTIQILGRDFLKKFGSTEFDWDTQKIRLEPIWKPSEAIIDSGDVIGRSHVASLEEDRSNNITGNLRQPPVRINPELSLPLQEKLKELCNEFADIFATNLKSPQLTRLDTHCIKTGPARPIKHKIRRVSPKVKNEIDIQVKEMLNNGICRRSESPRNSPVILVTKKDGSTRFVIDY